MTTYIGQKFDEVTHGSNFWDSTSGCAIRGGGSITGNEYYRLACGCNSFGQIDGTWRVYYFDDSSCSIGAGQSQWTAQGYCGSASSVTVSLFAGLAAIFAALKSM